MARLNIEKPEIIAKKQQNIFKKCLNLFKGLP